MENKKAFKSIMERLTALKGEAVALCEGLDAKDKPPMQMVNAQINAAYVSLMIAEGILFPASKTPKNPPKLKYGKHGWVKLTEAQYQALESRYGKALLERAITYIDESAQKNSNKNGWKDWSLVIHNCIRDDWGKVVSQPQKYAPKKQAEPSVYDGVDEKLLESFMKS